MALWSITYDSIDDVQSLIDQKAVVNLALNT